MKKIVIPTILLTTLLINLNTYSLMKFVKTQRYKNNPEKLLELGYGDKAKKVINKIDQDGYTHLMLACYNNNFKKCNIIIDDCTKKTIDHVDNGGYTALYWACSHNNFDIIKLLIQKKATIRQEDIEATTDEKIKSYLESVKKHGPSWKDKTPNGLLPSAPDLENKTDNDSTPLEFPSAPKLENENKNINEDLEITEMDLKEELEKEKLDLALLNLCEEKEKYYQEKLFNELYDACKKNNLDAVKSMLPKCKHIINKKNSWGGTPLYAACVGKNLEIVKLLIEYGANDCPLSVNYACVSYNLKLMKLLHKHIKSFERIIKNNYKYANIFRESMLTKGSAIAKFLFPLLNKRLIKGKINSGIPLIYYICRKNNIEGFRLVKSLITKESINFLHPTQYCVERTPFYWTCYHNNFEFVESLISKCDLKTINDNVPSFSGNKPKTPIYEASKHDNFKMAKLLLEKGAKQTINTYCDDENEKAPKTLLLAPLYWARKHKNKNMIGLLKKYGASAIQKEKSKKN